MNQRALATLLCLVPAFATATAACAVASDGGTGSDDTLPTDPAASAGQAGAARGGGAAALPAGGGPADPGASAPERRPVGADRADPVPPPVTRSAPSCARERGGATCGASGTDDCCAVADQGTRRIGKYMVTAGRMRTFVEAVGGNVRAFVGALPAGAWDASWTDLEALPTDRASADVVLGAAGKKSCAQGNYTGHTYWTPPETWDYSDYDRDTLDDKALNCVPWPMLQALCAFDGGHLATVADLRAAYTNDGTTTYPWGNEALASVSVPDPKGRLNLEGAYQTPVRPAAFRRTESGEPAEASYRIAPPGRFPAGTNRAGIADAAGNLLEWVGDAPRQFLWKGDFEHHAANAEQLHGDMWWERRDGKPIVVGFGPFLWGEGQMFGNVGTDAERHGYYAIGGRCAFSR